MPYVGVEFSENGSIGLVNSTWLTSFKRQVSWPPYKKNAAFNKARPTNEPPDQKSWKLFEVKRRFFECDDFEKAKNKLKICEVTSDVQSSEAELERDKRVRSKSRRYLTDSSESDIEEQSTSTLPRPPLLPVLVPKPTSATNSPGETISTPTTSKQDTSTNLTPVQPRQTVVYTPVQHSGRTITLAHGNTGLEKIYKEVQRLREEVKEVKAHLKQTKNTVSTGLPNGIPVEFPVKSVEDFQALDEYLATDDNQAELASYFSSLGGAGVTAQVNTILRFVLTNTLATQYNFFGQRNKLPFSTTKLKSVILRAIQSKCPNITQTDMENAIKIWLKHSKQGVQKQEQQLH